jgi:hypothetical protein
MILGLALAGMLAGCAVTDDGSETAEGTSALSFTSLVVYDAGTTCTVATSVGTTATMHCCPNGMAMIGAQVDKNVFKCAQLTGVSTGRFLDTNTVRNNMHACPQNAVMVGLHAGRNLLACQFPAPTPTFEFVDGNPPTTDGFPMHVCPPQYAMAGIHVDNNLFTCDF